MLLRPPLLTCRRLLDRAKDRVRSLQGEWVELFSRRCQGLRRSCCEQKYHPYLTFHSIKILILVIQKAPWKDRSFVYKIHSCKFHQPLGWKNRYRMMDDWWK